MMRRTEFTNANVKKVGKNNTLWGSTVDKKSYL